MENLNIEAKPREISGRKTKHLRCVNQIPAIVYGFEIEPTKIVVDEVKMEKLYRLAGESTVVKLELSGKSHDVLIQDIQRDPVSGFPIHIDFRRIDMTKKVEAKIRVRLIGITSAVKELGGTLLQSLEEVNVLALPAALVREIQVDISGIKTFEDKIRLADVVMPAGIELIDDVELVVASVQAPRSDAEMAALEGTVDADVTKVEVIKEKKDEAGAEGEAAAEGEDKK